MMRDYRSQWREILALEAARSKSALADPRSVAAQRERNATQETLRRKLDSVVDTMWARGKLTSEQRSAANEIAEIFEQFARAGAARVQEYEPRIRGGTQSTDWRAGLVTAYIQRYQPWRDEAGAICAGAGRTVFDLVIAIARNNYGFRQVACTYGLDQRTVLKRVRESLMRYAEIAGWVDETWKKIA